MINSTYPPFTLPGAYAKLSHICKEKLLALYGANPPRPAIKRLDAELRLLRRENLSSVYLLLHQLSVHLWENGGKLGVRGTLGATLVSFLLGLTDIDPLPAHDRCSHCGHMIFSPRSSGYELSPAACPNCDRLLQSDGHTIPYEACTELIRGKKVHTAEVNVSASAWETAVSFLTEFLGQERVACACEWDHPVCFMLLPEGVEFAGVTPMPTPVCGVRTKTLLPGHQLTHALFRLILLPCEDYDRIRLLHRLTGARPEDIDYSDPNIYTLFLRLDTCGIPGFSSDRSKEILQQLQALQFSDLIRVYAMTCGTGVWEGNGAQLLQQHPIRDLIATRDDIFLTLRRYGIPPKTAQAVMERVRKGSFCEDTAQIRQLTHELLGAGVPTWYVESMQRIRYLFPKAQAAQCARIAATLAWFKVYHPAAFYHVSLAVMGASPSEASDTTGKLPHSCNNAEVMALLEEAKRRAVPADSPDARAGNLAR